MSLTVRGVDAEDTRAIGRRLREIRYWRGKSLRVVAELAGISEGHLSRLERGVRALDRRSLVFALADALEVSPSEITGQPYPPSSRAEAVGHSAAPVLRAVLRDIELGEPVFVGVPRPMPELRAAVAAVTAAATASDYGTLGETVPSLLAELHALVEAADTPEARRLLASALHAAFYLAKDLGHGDLAWMVAGHLHRTAEGIGAAEWNGLAEFVRAHAVVGEHARQRALALAERAAEQLNPDDAETGQVYGMLHLSAALQAASLRDEEQARSHLTEASETAARTGDGTFAGLHFGPRNVGVWRVALAVEMGEEGRVVELANNVDVAAIPSAGRQATFFGDVGRGLARVRGREHEAVAALRQAEQLAPQRVRQSPYIRATVGELLGRARREAGGRELRGLAHRMGIGT